MTNVVSQILGECRCDSGDLLYAEFRQIGMDRRVKRVFVPIIHPINWQQAIAVPNQEENYNLYFGVLPRDKNHQPADHTHWLWGDFDNREDFLFQAVREFKVTPNIIVDSGRGMQVYWLLSAAMPTDMATIVMRGIAKFHNGDHTYDAARILRVPGTINRKNGAMARVLAYDPITRHAWSEFIDYAEAGRDRPQPARVVKYPKGDIPLWLIELIGRDPGKGMRSEHAFRVVCSLIEHGYDFEDIRTVFETNPDGVGAKYHEKGRNGTAWLKTTYNNARRII